MSPIQSDGFYNLQKGFIGLALRNEELLKSNDQLKQQFEIVVDELNEIKQELQSIFFK